MDLEAQGQMAMITGFLIAYAMCTTLLIGWAMVRSYKRAAKKSGMSPEVEALIKATFGKQGMHVENVHAIPEDPVEAVMVESRLIRKAISDAQAVGVQWFRHIADKLDVNKRDMDAMMIATRAITEALIKSEQARTPEAKQKPLDVFMRDMEYVRDTFAKTASERKAVESIISTMKTKYGAGAK